MKKKLFFLLIIAASSIEVTNACATTMKLDGFTISGFGRFYTVGKNFNSPTIENTNRSVFDGVFNVGTPSYSGFSAHASVYGNQELAQTDPGRPIGYILFGQSYLQYRNSLITVKAGNEEMVTPWTQSPQWRFLPLSMQGIFLSAAPLKGLNIYGLREFRFRSRSSNGFFSDNLYYNTGFDKDNYMFDQAGGLPGNAPRSNGTLAFGINYTNSGSNTKLWYYKFYNFANMLYAQTSYKIPLQKNVGMFAGVQFVREWDSHSYLNGVGIGGVSGSGVNSTTWGGRLGLYSHLGSLMFSYDNIQPHNGSVGGGAVISPFSAGYGTDPLYTSFINPLGLVEFGAGHAWQIGYISPAIIYRLHVLAAAGQYNTAYNGSNNMYDLVADYSINKNLSVNNHFFILNGKFGPKHLVYDRLMVSYNF